MNRKSILVTGGAGFIGSNFIHYILQKYPGTRIINYDSLTYAGNLSNLKDIESNSNYTFIKGNICDKNQLNSVFETYNPDYTVNFAAESHVDKSILDPETFIKTNICGVQNLLKLSLDHNVSKYIQISTDEVYGSLGETGYFTEDTPLDPRSPYSASKASADLLTNAYSSTFGLPIQITRCSNNYGPYQFPEKLIPLIISNCLKGRKIPVYGDGRNVRDWLFVDDHCSAIDAVITDGVVGETYNIGGNNEKTNIDIITTIISLLQEKLPDKKILEDLITYVEDRKGHDRRYAIDSTKIKTELKWKPEVSFENGLEQTIQWYLDNQKWLDCVENNDYLAYYEQNYANRISLH